MNYLDVYYSYKEKPVNNYPIDLVCYLCCKFDIHWNTNVLDLGCGRGDFSAAFYYNDCNVVGIDKNKQLPIIPTTKKYTNTAEFKTFDFTHGLPLFKEEQFDIVFAKSIIEHIDNYDLLLKDIYKVLKPGGKLIIMTPSWRHLYKEFYDDYTHKHPFTLDSLNRILQSYNFKVEYCKYFRQLPFLWGLEYWDWDMLNIKKTIKFWKHVMLLGVGVK